MKLRRTIIKHWQHSNEPSHFSLLNATLQSVALLVLISPTFYKQLLRQNPFTKKLQTQNCKYIKGAQKNFRTKNLLIKY